MSLFKSVTGAATTDTVSGVLPRSGTICNLAAFTGNTPTYEFDVLGASGLKIVASVTTGSTGSTTTIQIDGWDPASNAWVPVLTGTGTTTTGVSVYEVNPHISAAAASVTKVAQTALFETMRVYALSSGTGGSVALVLGFHTTA